MTVSKRRIRSVVPNEDFESSGGDFKLQLGFRCIGIDFASFCKDFSCCTYRSFIRQARHKGLTTVKASVKSKAKLLEKPKRLSAYTKYNEIFESSVIP